MRRSKMILLTILGIYFLSVLGVKDDIIFYKVLNVYALAIFLAFMYKRVSYFRNEL